MNQRNRPLLAAPLALAALCLAAPALAGEMPKRKSGLWEMNSRMDGMPSHGAIQICVDQASDDLMEERGRRDKPDCSAMDVKRNGGQVSVHSVCRHEGTTVTTDAVITGDFESGYRSDMRMRYSPPLHGMSEMRVIQEAKWLGPCKAGQKPGDVVIPGVPAGMNLQEMMKRRQN